MTSSTVLASSRRRGGTAAGPEVVMVVVVLVVVLVSLVCDCKVDGRDMVIGYAIAVLCSGPRSEGGLGGDGRRERDEEDHHDGN